MSSFVERVVDVIGADPNIPDSVFREMFSAAGDIAWVTRWSSAGQKHHAFLGFKTPQMAVKALSLPVSRTLNREWRLSRLNPDLKTRVIELLPKYIQTKIKAEEALLASRPPPAAPNGDPSSAHGSASGGDAWAPPSMEPSMDGWQVSSPTYAPGPESWTPAWQSEPMTPYGTGSYGGPPTSMPWNTASAPVGISHDIVMPMPDMSMMDNGARPTSRASNRPDFTDVVSQSGARPRSSSPKRWDRDPNRPPSPFSPASFRSLPPKPNTVGAESRDYKSRYPPRVPASGDPRDRTRDNERYPPSRRSPPPPGPGSRFAPRPQSPVRALDRDPRHAIRRDTRSDDRGREPWSRNVRERSARSRSHSPDGGRSRSPARSIRDLRAPPHGRDPRGNDFRRPLDPTSRAMSPGQLSSTTVMDRAPSLNGLVRSFRSQSPSPTSVQDLTSALTSRNAPLSSWMEVLSRYRRRHELDAADQIAMAAIDYFKRTQPNSPNAAKPFHLVLANTHNTRARQLPLNSDDANTWQAKASEWIRQAQALGASGDENPAHDASDGLAWLQKHMLDMSIPRDVDSPSSPGRAHNGVPTSQKPIADSAHDARVLAEQTARFDDLQSKHQHAVSQLRAEQVARKRLEDRVTSLEGLLRAAEAKLVAADARERSGGIVSGDEPDLLRRAEAEKTRLLAIISDERIAKRRAEDAEQEERAVRRKLEDQLWMLGANVEPPTL